MNSAQNPNLSSTACQTIMGKIQHALQRHIPERCYELTRTLQETSHKELHVIFPYLVESIFGFGNKQPGWGLMGIARSQKVHEFIALQEFLNSKGPLIEVAYRLLSDGRAQYEFPVSCLPLTTRHLLEEGNIPCLYTNKVPFCGPGRPISHVMLNPFEYYFFHFAYFIVNPAHSKDSSFPSTLVDSLYPSLLEDYLGHFLPINSNAVTPIPHTLQPHYRSMTYTSPSYLAMHPNYLGHSSPNIYGQNVAYEGFQSYNSQQTYQNIKRNILSSPTISGGNVSMTSVSETSQDEIWRSQSLVLILVEFWLNLSSSDTPGVMLNHVFQEAFIPSHVQMQLVRLFIKHLHYFTNSAISEADNNNLANLSFQQNPIEELKRTVIVQQIQKKLYTFLKLSFERWPIDSYFRLVLETWLSYIQPWRYESFPTENNQKNLSKKEQDKYIDLKWKDFVAENLLFYTGIFQQLLPRYFRVELNSPRYSYLLLRVTKVFSMLNLQRMIVDAENRLLEPTIPQFANHMFQSSSSGQLRQYVYDLEGFGFNYEPMFGANVRAQVLSLLSHIGQAKLTIQRKETNLASTKKGWFQYFYEFFTLDASDKEEITIADIKKTETYLDLSAGQLCSMFKLNMPSVSFMNNDIQNSTESSQFLQQNKKGLPDTPCSFHEVIYKGNPDLQPIRSYEVAFLVRLFYHLSTLINERYQNDINSLYTRQDWLGRICQQLLAPPIICQELSPSKRKDIVALPPRVSLRILAHCQLLAYLSFFYLISYLFGYGPFSFLILVSCTVLIYVVIRAAVCPR